MKRSEYEERRRALEETFEAEIATVRAAQQIRRRAFEALWRADLEDDEPSQAPAAPSMPPPPPLHLAAALEEILPRLPEVFDKDDVVRLLGWNPARATLFRNLQGLVFSGRLKVERYGAGRATTTYRKKADEAR
jgi:hypothetical protein